MLIKASTPHCRRLLTWTFLSRIWFRGSSWMDQEIQSQRNLKAIFEGNTRTIWKVWRIPKRPSRVCHSYGNQTLLDHQLGWNQKPSFWYPSSKNSMGPRSSRRTCWAVEWQSPSSCVIGNVVCTKGAAERGLSQNEGGGRSAEATAFRRKKLSSTKKITLCCTDLVTDKLQDTNLTRKTIF